FFGLLPTEASGDYATALGAAAWAPGFNSTALGAWSTASGDDAVALGADSVAAAAGSVALGQGSVADRAGTVSVGSAGGERQITHVAAGRIASGSTDATNGGQFYDAPDSVAQALAGGAEVTAFGTVSAPAFMIQGSTYCSVGDALGAVDAEISLLGSRLTALEGGGMATGAAAAGRRLGTGDAGRAHGDGRAAAGPAAVA